MIGIEPGTFKVPTNSRRRRLDGVSQLCPSGSLTCLDNSSGVTTFAVQGAGMDVTFIEGVQDGRRARQLSLDTSERDLLSTGGLFQVLAGAPVVVFSDLTFNGSVDARAVFIEKANVRFERCRFVGFGSAYIDGGALRLRGGGTLDCVGCILENNAGRFGGALLVEDGTASLRASSLHSNEAWDLGGAIAVWERGVVGLSERSIIYGNNTVRAPVDGDNSSRSVYVHPGGTFEYTLPAPLGHWISAGRELSVASTESMDLEYPFQCAPGLIGDNDDVDSRAQSTPGCNGPCPKGFYCPAATAVAIICPAGSFCPIGSATPTPCNGGSYSNEEGLASGKQCKDCPLGAYCPEGATEPVDCRAGTAGKTTNLQGPEYCFNCIAPSTSDQGQSSCAICQADYFWVSNESKASPGDAECKACLPNAVCPQGTTYGDIKLDDGAWRFSERSFKVQTCLKRDGWSPCDGGNRTLQQGRRQLQGALSGEDGDGYCKLDHKGPRCTLCVADAGGDKRYFDEGTAKCKECPNPWQRVGILVGALAGFMLLCAAVYVWYTRPVEYWEGESRWKRAERWLRAWMLHRAYEIKNVSVLPKLKLLIVFFQAVRVIPDGYGVKVPQVYQDIAVAFEWISVEWVAIVVPTGCLESGYAGRLLLSGLLPLGLMLIALVLGPLVRIVKHTIKGGEGPGPWKAGLLDSLNLILFISFIFVVSISEDVFLTWSCETFEVDSMISPPTERRFLRQDFSIECDTAEHAQAKAVAYGMMVIWPIGVPILYASLLYACRIPLTNQKTTNLGKATSFLHKEYNISFFWWELAFLVFRLTIGGYLLLIPDSVPFLRLIAALLVALMFMVLLMLTRPYKKQDVNLMAQGALFMLVCILVTSLCLQLYEGISGYTYACSAEDGDAIANDLMGFSSDDQIVYIMIAFNATVLVCFFAITAWQAWKERGLPNIRLLQTKEIPELSLGRGQKWHLFLSHIWSSGQDQVATIKRQLQLLLPGVSVFLDVDDLVEIGDLEWYIEASQCILIFLSKGYFFSRNCLREMDHSLLLNKPLVLVHEVDPGKGGAPLETLMSDCPDEACDAVFGGKERPSRDIIVWHRISDFQLISLKMVAARLLHATPKFDSRPMPVLYVPGEISRLPLGFKKRTHLFVSPKNPGAAVLADELRSRYRSGGRTARDDAQAFGFSYNMPASMANVNLNDTNHVFGGIDDIRSVAGAVFETSFETARAALETRFGKLGRISARLSTLGRASKKNANQGPATHMLLYLAHSTFEGEDGNDLADEVRRARAAGVPVILVHEVDPENGGCPFSRFFETTPQDLISNGLYKTIAIAFPAYPHRSASYALLARALGAVKVSKAMRSSIEAGERDTRATSFGSDWSGNTRHSISSSTTRKKPTTSKNVEQECGSRTSRSSDGARPSRIGNPFAGLRRRSSGDGNEEGPFAPNAGRNTFPSVIAEGDEVEAGGETSSVITGGETSSVIEQAAWSAAFPLSARASDARPNPQEAQPNPQEGQSNPPEQRAQSRFPFLTNIFTGRWWFHKTNNAQGVQGVPQAPTAEVATEASNAELGFVNLPRQSV